MHLLIIGVLLLVAGYLLQSFLVPKQHVKPAALEEWDFPQADEGTPQVVVFGDAWLKGPMILWYGDYRTIKIKAGGGKK